jgi:tetratricopeptide (TPR) repeat protein
MTLSERHERELQALQSSSRLNFTVVAIVACFGLLALAVMAFFLFRATNRLAALPQAFAQLTAPGAAVPSAGRFLLAGTTSADANARLLSVVGLLEKKFGDLERAVETTPAVAAPGQPAELGVAMANGNGHSHEHAPRSAPAPEADALRGLLARGQRQLDEDATDDALRTLDEALALAPRNTDALVKRGKALEKLGRMEDALRCYDRALEIDDSLTIAHLSKGGVYNRLDRFGEALECYERALQTQAAPAATQVAA